MVLVIFTTAQETIDTNPELRVTATSQPALSAKSWLIMDLESGTEVGSFNSSQPLPIASITKLFTAAAFKEHTNLFGTTTVTYEDVATEGRSGKLAAGELYPYHELVQALLVESSNDAATTIARADDLVLERMNEYPHELGFTQTQFADPSGLSDKNTSTAYELAMLTRYLWKLDPYLFDVSNMEQIIGTHTGWINNNPFINLAGYKGGKHGFTNEANRTAVAIFSDTPNDQARDFLYVLLGSDDLTEDMATLRAYVEANVRYE